MISPIEAPNLPSVSASIQRSITQRAEPPTARDNVSTLVNRPSCPKVLLDNPYHLASSIYRERSDVNNRAGNATFGHQEMKPGPILFGTRFAPGELASYTG